MSDPLIRSAQELRSVRAAWLCLRGRAEMRPAPHHRPCGVIARVALWIAAAWLGVWPARADIAPLTEYGHGIVIPDSLDRRLSRVIMQSEDVRIELGLDSIRVDATFVMFNPGAAAKGVVGFPDAAETSTQASNRLMRKVEGRLSPVLRELEVSIDGERVATRMSDRPANSAIAWQYAWYLFNARFAAHRESRVEVSYWVSPTPAYNPTGRERRHFAYILETGALWSGRIGLATVTMHLGPTVRREAVVSIRPAEGEWVNGQTWEWSARDIEPTGSDAFVIYWDGISAEDCLARARADLAGEPNPADYGYHVWSHVADLWLMDCGWQAGDTLLSRQQALWLLRLDSDEICQVCVSCIRLWGKEYVSAPMAWFGRICEHAWDPAAREAARRTARAEVDHAFQPLPPER